MDNEGAYVARVVEDDGRWRAYLTVAKQWLAGDHPTSTAAMVAVDAYVARHRPRPAVADIHKDILALRGISHIAPCRYQQILHAGLGPGVEVATAVHRLKEARYVSGDDRQIEVTDEGRAALRRLDDPAAKERLLADLFYGEHRPPDGQLS
jgi:hypothetical protein